MNKLRKQRSNINNNLTKLGEYVQHWYKIYKIGKHEISTIHVQLSYINTHIIPSKLGKMVLTSVRTSDIQEFLNDLLISGNKSKLKGTKKFGQPLAKSTVKKIRAILISAFKQALKEDLVNRNYAADTESIVLPKTKKHDFFTHEEEMIFLEKTKNHRYHLAYKLLFLTGCRREEVLGLTWKNVNFKHKYIFFNQTLVIPDKTPIVKKTTKTSASIRKIPLPAQVINELKKHFKKQKEEEKQSAVWGNYDNQLIFVDKNGFPYSPRNLSQNMKKMIKRLGLNPNLHLHCTRHTFATNMFQLNIPLTDIRALGGWSSSDTLLNIYAHTVQTSHRKAIKKLYDKNLT